MSAVQHRIPSADAPAAEAIVPADSPGRQAFWDLERWLSGKQARSQGLHQVEVQEELQGREMLRRLFQEHIDGRGDGDVGPALWVTSPDDPSDRLLHSHRRLHVRQLVTIFGTVFVRRFGYGRPGEASIHPLDAELQLPARSYSYEIQRRVVKAALRGPFDEALGAVAEGTGVGIPKRSAEQMVIEAAVDFESFYAQRTGLPRTPTGSLLVASVDGKGIPMVKREPTPRRVRLRKGEKRNKKRMSTVAAVFTQERNARTPEDVVESLFDDGQEPSPGRRRERYRPEHKRVWASLLSSKEAFLQDVREEMHRRDPQHGKTWVAVTDGERALQRLVCARLDKTLLVLDLLHVMEKLWEASHALHPEGSPEAEAFVRERALRILRGGVSQVVKGLRQMVTKRRLEGAKRKTLLRIAAYYYHNRDRMHYDDYLRKGYPIASGSVEGACKNLVKDRMERSGMRWTPTMAEAMLRLRAVYLSGDFEEYWNYHVAQEQQRLCPKDRWRRLVSVVQK